MIHHYAAFVVGSVVVWGSVAAFAGLVYGLGEAIGSTAWYRESEHGGLDKYALALSGLWCAFLVSILFYVVGLGCYAVGAAVLGGGGR